MKSVWTVTRTTMGVYGRPIVAAPTRKQAKAFVDAEFPAPDATWSKPDENGDVGRYAYMAVQSFRVSKVKLI